MSGRMIRVLLVEDDEDDYLITRRLLDAAPGQHFELAWVSCFRQAEERLRSDRPDVLLLDLNLPDSSGWEALDRAHELTPVVPIILLTGAADDSLGVEALRRGAHDYLTKGSTDAAQLARSIRYAIQRKASDSALRLYRERLEELVQRRTAELSAANRELQVEVAQHLATEAKLKQAIDRLEELDDAKSQFVSNVSHELKTPLTSIGYAADNLLAEVLGPLSPRVREYVSMIKEDCERLAHTVNDILDLTRLDSHTLRLHRVKLPLSRFARGVAEAMRLQAAARSQEMVVRAEGRSGFVHCDPQKLERVIVNILANALKYTPEHGRIEVSVCHESPEELVLCVIDNGVGIAPEHLARVMERYFRVGDHVSGTGLGLSLSRDIIELHGGHVALSSPPPGRERGTQVTVRLPAVAPPLVLIADAESPGDSPAAAALAAAGYAAEAVAGGVDEWLRRAGRGCAAAIVACFAGDPAPGLELLARIKSEGESARALPLVAILTAATEPVYRDVLRGFEIPCLTEPWTQESLIDCVDRAVTGGPAACDEN